MSDAVTVPPPRTSQEADRPHVPEGGAAPAHAAPGGLAGALAGAKAVVAETVGLGRDLAAITAGTARTAPAPEDRRFADPAWRDNPAYRRLGQGYLAWSAALDRLVDRYQAGGGDPRAVERARFAVGALTSAAAPTNTLLGNPAALKKAVETGGRSVVRGAKALVTDVVHNGGLPQQTDRSAFVVGRDVAVTPGAVVYRDEVIELIQYRPTTARVRERPLLLVPPMINRYYMLDLRPGRSFVEYAVAQGLQVFLISWRNPSRQHAHWDLDTYAERIRRAIAVARQVTGSPDVNTMGFCAGGIVLTTLLNHLAAVEDTSVHSAAFGVTLLDFSGSAPINAFSGRRMVGLSKRISRTRGVIPARTMGSVFTWMRPDDLIFNYLVDQWLMGQAPPAFDVLAWNADGTNLPAALHEQFLRIYQEHTLVRPGAETVLGSPVDLGSITVPTFVTGAVTDHITPWTGCYRTTQLFSGPSTFVLSSSGHVQSLVNPPGNPRMNWSIGSATGPDPEEWRATAERHTGSWWESWAPWTVERSGDEVPAPRELGSGNHPPLEAAPGSYVLDRVPG
ncbi:alpha/beta fold hydrolase [Geodermatophilus sabuli]|uniref:Alpha/beta fold hydrolase n=1 Tax=Geodermatophilus sabuli TaxID=1564158 RepID=A0A7K3VZE5_9ACTN|nr:alpha/beta fold hydrolase [Geodermatophilus sabuli]NEK57007.1 alpha/beta fold hydrolase [Geodermatophilus sabuli]